VSAIEPVPSWGPRGDLGLLRSRVDALRLGRGSPQPRSVMVSVTVSAAKKTSLAKDLPVVLSFPGKSSDAVTIADVKRAFAAKYPKVHLIR
jgi:hypothetical protein